MSLTPAQGIGKLEPELLEPYRKWKEADTPGSRSALLTASQPMINSAMRSYGYGPSAQGRAKIIAAKSFGSYDPTRGTMRTHLLSQLRGLQRHNQRAVQGISIPERVAIDRSHLRETESQLRDYLGRDPSDAEISSKTGLSLSRLKHIRQAKPATAAGSILDTEGEVYAPPSQLAQDNSAEEAWQELIYYDLNDVDRAIMDFTFGLHGSPKLDNPTIAKRLGVTPGAISQRRKKIDAMMSERHNVGLF